MILAVIRELAQKYTKSELDKAALVFESDGTNLYEVQGKDEGEILTNLLMAAVVREKVDSGLSLQEAIRDHSRSIQKVLTAKKNSGTGEGNSGGGGTRFF